MSKIVKHNGTVYLCGQVCNGASITAQTKDCLARVGALLTKAGTDCTRILQAIIWLADMADFAEMNAVWNAWVSAGPHSHGPVEKPSLPTKTSKSQ